jgi:hypothetical protein
MAYTPPEWYPTVDEYLALLRDTLVESGFAADTKYHPEDLWANATTIADSMNSAFVWISPRIRSV